LQCVAVCQCVDDRRGDVEERLQVCVAVCCSVLQCVAVCCSVLQCVNVLMIEEVMWRSGCRCVLQCVAVCCSVLQYIQITRKVCSELIRRPVAVEQFSGVCCSVMRCVALWCSVVQ